MNKYPLIDSSVNEKRAVRSLKEFNAFIPVHVQRGPTGRAVYVSNISEYEEYFGAPSTEHELISYSIVKNALGRGGVYAYRYLGSDSSYALNDPNNPSPNQVVDVIIRGDTTVIEQSSGTIIVEILYADGSVEDISEQSNTFFSVADESFGFISGNTFFANDKLGDVTLIVQTRQGTFYSKITVALLEVDYLEIIGPTTITAGDEHQFRSVAYFVDGSVRDVTFEEDTSWVASGGSFNEFSQGFINGHTLSVETTVDITVTHENGVITFQLTIEPTYFNLISAGPTVTGLGKFNVPLRPVYEGDRYSHTVEWVMHIGAGAYIENTIALETLFVVEDEDLADFYELRLYIDKDTSNEQMESFDIIRGAFSILQAFYETADFYEVMKAQGRTGRGGDSLDGQLDHTISQEISMGISGNPVINYVVFQHGTTFEILWGGVYDKQLLRVSSTELQKKFGSGEWFVTDSFEDQDSVSVSGKTGGHYRIKMVFSYLDAGFEVALITDPFYLRYNELKHGNLSLLTASYEAYESSLSGYDYRLEFLRKLTGPESCLTGFYEEEQTHYLDKSSFLLTRVDLPGDFESVFTAYYEEFPDSLITGYTVNHTT